MKKEVKAKRNILLKKKIVRGKTVTEMPLTRLKRGTGQDGKKTEREINLCLKNVRRKICILNVTWTVVLLESKDAKIMGGSNLITCYY